MNKSDLETSTSMEKVKVAYVTSTRADFGLMTPILKAIESSKKLDLQIYITGMHLMTSRGKTLNIVLKEFPNSKILDAYPKGDSNQDIAEFCTGLSSKLVTTLSLYSPDVVLILGDRQEMLQVAVCAYYLRIAIAHVHGGERTTTDDPARHAISKLASIHFPATRNSANRLIKMGEDKSRVNIVGAPALDAIHAFRLPSLEKTRQFLGVDKSGYILVVLHPSAGEMLGYKSQMKNVLKAVESFDLNVVVVYPNVDAGGSQMIDVIEEEKVKNSNILTFRNIPYEQFLAVEKHTHCWVGNSSAAIIESSSFRVPVVDVGNRQHGRLHGGNVIHVGYNVDDITRAIKKSLYNKTYIKSIKKIKNPWGDGNSGYRVAKILEGVKFDSVFLNKQIIY